MIPKWNSVCYLWNTNASSVEAAESSTLLKTTSSTLAVCIVTTGWHQISHTGPGWWFRWTCKHENLKLSMELRCSPRDPHTSTAAELLHFWNANVFSVMNFSVALSPQEGLWNFILFLHTVAKNVTRLWCFKLLAPLLIPETVLSTFPPRLNQIHSLKMILTHPLLPPSSSPHPPFTKLFLPFMVSDL